MKQKKALASLIAAGLLTTSLTASAELGDYGFWKTLSNLFSPPKADNPVTSEQANAAQYPLVNNPQGFSDGFSPGSYLNWQTVQLDPSTGALCGNGSPFKFFVNRVAHTSNTIIYMEGGGACWDYESCTGQTGIRGARNPDGIPDDYMSLLNPGASLVSPLVFRLHPWSGAKTQAWNMIYVPYCTGDTYTGDKVALYEDPSGEKEPLVWYHNGIKNVRSVVAWLKNNLQRPAQMMVAGCSAGSTGTLANYHPIRRDMEPSKGFLLNDSGPIYPAPVDGNLEQYPSILLHEKIRDAWGLDTNGNGPLDYIANELPAFSLNNMGTLYNGLAEKYVNDRMGHTQFWQDLNYSSYSYERFYEDIYNDPDQASREEKIHTRWHQDTNNLKSELEAYDNFGYFLPHYRGVNESHCTTIIEFANSDIQEQGLELDDFIDNLMNGNGAVMQASETDTQSDYEKGFNLLYWLLDQLL
ncbi:pectin acetylesterase-family hydrolase [Aliikangiella sp. G2MR2-5]|uniref:pectin acetylesterase-family hydrolase n=1 Tax=Aliikangiella sp. G2MR2-5 TaxID=2788943 RepID=UPI0018A8F8EE|nr:pectin acetylesterase-family hydrolase [Aliikangiella sp. G2MR2-5]